MTDTGGFPIPADDGGARHLTRRKRLPDLDLVTTRGDTLSLGRHPGWLVLYCYTWTGRPGVTNPPGWDDIPGAHGSTPESIGFCNLHSSFRGLGAEVVGVSTQDTAWQQEFATRLALPFPLASDAALALTRALDLPTFEKGGATYLKRLTMVLRDGRIERVFYPVHPPETHPREVLAWLSAHLSYAVEARPAAAAKDGGKHRA